MKTSKQRLAAMMFAGLVMVTSVLPTLASQTAYGIMAYVGFTTGSLDSFWGGFGAGASAVSLLLVTNPVFAAAGFLVGL